MYAAHFCKMLKTSYKMYKMRLTYIYETYAFSYNINIFMKL